MQGIGQHELADGLEDHIRAASVKRSPVPVRLAAVEAGVFELDRRDMPALGQKPQRPGPMLDLHAVDLGEVLLVLGGAHMARGRGDRRW